MGVIRAGDAGAGYKESTPGAAWRVRITGNPQAVLIRLPGARTGARKRRCHAASSVGISPAAIASAYVRMSGPGS